MSLSVLVTGGLGYIGGHAVQRLLRDGHEVTILDNLFRGHREVLERLAPLGRVRLVQADISDRPAVREAVLAHKVDAVMHFAALAYVGESVESPLTYYRNNVSGMIELLTALDEARRLGTHVGQMVFSSTCAVYGDGSSEPLTERSPLAPVSPYGRSKLMCEQVLRDESARLAACGVGFSSVCLRYFNVCGCDRSGALGEDHRPETHLIPIVLDVARGRRPCVTVFGDDYPTPDGTCVRDYIHVEDLVDAHVLAMGRQRPGQDATYNVGVGRSASVLDVVRAVRDVTGAEVPVRVEARRAGDAAAAVADPSCIMRELGWRPQVPGLREMIESAWRWMRAHPGGYGT